MARPSKSKAAKKPAAKKKATKKKAKYTAGKDKIWGKNESTSGYDMTFRGRSMRGKRLSKWERDFYGKMPKTEKEAKKKAKYELSRLKAMGVTRTRASKAQEKRLEAELTRLKDKKWLRKGAAEIKATAIKEGTWTPPKKTKKKVYGPHPKPRESKATKTTKRPASSQPTHPRPAPKGSVTAKANEWWNERERKRRARERAQTEESVAARGVTRRDVDRGATRLTKTKEETYPTGKRGGERKKSGLPTGRVPRGALKPRRKPTKKKTATRKPVAKKPTAAQVKAAEKRLADTTAARKKARAAAQRRAAHKPAARSTAAAKARRSGGRRKK